MVVCLRILKVKKIKTSSSLFVKKFSINWRQVGLLCYVCRSNKVGLYRKRKNKIEREKKKDVIVSNVFKHFENRIYINNTLDSLKRILTYDWAITTKNPEQIFVFFVSMCFFIAIEEHVSCSVAWNRYDKSAVPHTSRCSARMGSISRGSWDDLEPKD